LSSAERSSSSARARAFRRGTLEAGILARDVVVERNGLRLELEGGTDAHYHPDGTLDQLELAEPASLEVGGKRGDVCDGARSHGRRARHDFFHPSGAPRRFTLAREVKTPRRAIRQGAIVDLDKAGRLKR
jgi:hypothetical protein